MEQANTSNRFKGIKCAFCKKEGHTYNECLNKNPENFDDDLTQVTEGDFKPMNKEKELIEKIMNKTYADENYRKRFRTSENMLRDLMLISVQEAKKELIEEFEKMIERFEDIEFEKQCKLNHEETDCLQCYTLHILNELKQQLQELKEFRYPA